MHKSVHRRRAEKQLINDADSRNVPVAYVDTVQADKRRKHLLLLTRRADPLFAVFDFRHITYTALPRVLTSLNMFIIMATFAATAVTSRYGYWIYTEDANAARDDGDAVVGMELLVTFNLVFYFGYCYNRFWQQAELAFQAKNAISAVCSLVRASSMADEDVTNVWKWLNLAHITGYVGLSPVYTRVNLLEGISKDHDLMGRRSYERKRIDELDIEASGPLSYGEFMVWVLTSIEQNAHAGRISVATLENCQAMILAMRAGLTGLFDLQTHVIPFCYVHLAALLTNSYLIVTAIAKGRLCAPDSTWGRGLVFPLCALFFLSISCLCLIEIGGRMQNPLGADEEDLPVHHFVERTCVTTKALIDYKPPPSLRKAALTAPSPTSACAGPESSYTVNPSYSITPTTDALPAAEPVPEASRCGGSIEEQLSRRSPPAQRSKMAGDPLSASTSECSSRGGGGFMASMSARLSQRKSKRHHDPDLPSTAESTMMDPLSV